MAADSRAIARAHARTFDAGRIQRGDADWAGDLVAMRDRTGGAGGQVPRPSMASRRCAGNLHAWREPSDATGRRGMPRCAQAVGGASVPWDGLDAEERKGLDSPRVPGK